MVNMSSADLAAWISAATGLISLIVAIVALVKSTRSETKLEYVERQLAFTQVAMHLPISSTGGGGGGGGGFGAGAGGAGGAVNYQPNQSGNVHQP